MADQNSINNVQLNKANNLSDLASKTAAARNLPVRNIIAAQTTNFPHPSGVVTNIVMSSLLIPAGSFGANDAMILDTMITKAATVAGITLRLYISPDAGTPGSVIPGTAVLVAIGSTFGTGMLYGRPQRTLIAQNATNAQIGFSNAAGVNIDIVTASNAASTYTIDFTADQYYIVAIQLGNSADTATLRWAQVSIDKSP